MRRTEASSFDLLRTAEGHRLKQVWSSDAALDLAKGTTKERWDEVVDDYLRKVQRAKNTAEECREGD